MRLGDKTSRGQISGGDEIKSRPTSRSPNKLTLKKDLTHAHDRVRG